MPILSRPDMSSIILRVIFFRGLLVLCLAIGGPSPNFHHGKIDVVGVAHADDGGNGGSSGGSDGGGDGGAVWRGGQVHRPIPPAVRRMFDNIRSKAPSMQGPPPKARSPSSSRQQPTPARSVARIGDFEPREVLAINASRTVLNRARNLGFTILRTETLRQLDLRVTRLRPPANQSPPQALRLLQRRIPNGDFALNHVYRTAAGPCPEERCYGSSLIGWDQAAESCGGGIKLGMVDTAANGKAPALADRRLVTRSFADNGRPSSPTHGTAVAALLVGAATSEFPGLLPAAELYAADTFMGTGANLRTNALLLGKGLDWLLEREVAVVNASLTGPDNRLLHEVIKRLGARNVVVIAAAGNGGPSAPPAFPAAYPETFSVTAVDHLLRPYRLANRGEYLTVAAPGVRIWTPGPKGGRYSDGTSFATPYVTAVAALLRHRQPDLDAAGLVAQLQTDARDLGAPGKDPVFGWGLVQSPGRCE